MQETPGHDAADASITLNRRLHDRVARYYHLVHLEIYNPTEQMRLRDALGEAIGRVRSADERDAMVAIEVGVGRGNVTTHLLRLGCSVVATDISEECLRSVRTDLEPCYGPRLRTSLLNGVDLSQFEEGTFDFACCYSVLHHVPDYLRLVGEMVRVLKPGGVLFVDHEVATSAWKPDADLIRYRKDLARAYPRRWYSKIVSMPLAILPWYLRRALTSRWRKMSNPRFAIEGDLHIWPDQHVEWDAVAARAKEVGCDEVAVRDYLLCREPTWPAPVYERHRGRCVDMSYAVGIKRGPSRR